MNSDLFLSNLLLKEELSDVRVIVENKMEKWNFPAHGLVLKRLSPVIAKMLESDFVEGRNRTILITDFKAIHIEAFLRYLYTDILPESYTGLCKLVKIANKYLVSKLTESCEESLLDFVNLQNVYELCNLAETYSLEKLLDRCLFLIKRAAFKLLKCDDLKCLSKDTMEKIVRADDLGVTNEMDVFWAIWKWGNLKFCFRGAAFGNNDVKEFTKDLLKHVRWSLADDDDDDDDEKDEDHIKLIGLGITVDRPDLLKECQPRKPSTVDTPWFLNQCDILHMIENAFSRVHFNLKPSSHRYNLMQLVSLSDSPFYVVGVLLVAYTKDPVASTLMCSCESSCSTAKIPLEVDSSLSLKKFRINQQEQVNQEESAGTSNSLHLRDIMYEFSNPIEVRRNQKLNISMNGTLPGFSSVRLKFHGKPIYSNKRKALFVHGNVYGIKKVFLL